MNCYIFLIQWFLPNLLQRILYVFFKKMSTNATRQLDKMKLHCILQMTQAYRLRVAFWVHNELNLTCTLILSQNVSEQGYSLFCFSVLVSLGRCAEAALLTPWLGWTGGLFSGFSSSLLSSSESLLSSASTWVSLEETCQENQFG